MSSESHRRDTIFLSYCKEDLKWLELLKKHLKPRLRQQPMVVWDNSQISAGAVVQDELRAALKHAAVAVLLVTPDYLNSDAIANEELPRFFEDARKGGLIVLWIAIKASAVSETPIANYKALNDSKNPLIGRHYAHRDRELERICRVIQETWLKQCVPEDPPDPVPNQAPRHQEPPATGTKRLDSSTANSLSPAEAQRRVHAVLGGQVSDFQLWRDESRKLYMAATTGMRLSADARIEVLEQAGLTFRRVWVSEELLSPPRNIEIVDIDSDGVAEVLFQEKAHGRVCADNRLTIYFPARRLAVCITESWVRGPAVPVAPAVTIEPEIELDLLRKVERAAMERGFLQGVGDYDLDSPLYATQRWHAEHGGPGKNALHFFNGAPKLNGSVVATLQAGGYEWIAEFKGALYAYDIQRNRHFVVFSAEDFYNWPKCLAYRDGVLWFSIHMEPAVCSFTVTSRVLRRHDLGAAANHYGVDEIAFDEERHELVLIDHEGSELRRPISELLAEPPML